MKAKIFVIVIIICCSNRVLGQSNSVSERAGHIAYLIEPNYFFTEFHNWQGTGKTILRVNFRPEDSSMTFINDEKLEKMFLNNFGNAMVEYALGDSLPEYNELEVWITHSTVSKTFTGDLPAIYKPSRSINDRFSVLAMLLPFTTTATIKHLGNNCKGIRMTLDVPDIATPKIDLRRYSYILATVMYQYVLRQSEEFVNMELHFRQNGRDMEVYDIDLTSNKLEEVYKTSIETVARFERYFFPRD